MEEQNNLQPNNLFILRTSRGLAAKQVARMLGQLSSGQVSGYERGKIPALENFLKLMLIYEATPKEMYPELIERCRRDIEATIRQRTFLFRYPERIKLLEAINSCSYEDRLDHEMSDDDKKLIKSHIIKLSQKAARI